MAQRIVVSAIFVTPYWHLNLPQNCYKHTRLYSIHLLLASPNFGLVIWKVPVSTRIKGLIMCEVRTNFSIFHSPIIKMLDENHVNSATPNPLYSPILYFPDEEDEDWQFFNVPNSSRIHIALLATFSLLLKMLCQQSPWRPSRIVGSKLARFCQQQSATPLLCL